MPVLGLSQKPAPVAGPELHVFAVRAAPDPQVMLRVANLFAQRNIVPDQICCRRSGRWLLVDIEAALESVAEAALLLEKLRSMVLVERASLVGGTC